MEQILLDELRKTCLPLLSKQGIELVELGIARERGSLVLRFLVDKAGGITLDECARLNQEISRLLDAQDIVQESCVLEVSSPGLDRPLRSTRDFQRCLGQLVKIVLHQPVSGQNVWIAIIDSVDEENVVIRAEKEQRLPIARRNIAWAKREVEV